MSSQELHKDKILIIDDMRSSVKIITMILTHAGYSAVQAVTDTENSCAAFKSYDPDLVILSIRTKPQSGFDIISELKQLIEMSNFVPILMVNVDPDRFSIERSIASGATDYLCNPFDARLVVHRVQLLLHSRRIHVAQEQERMNFIEQTTALRFACEEIVDALARVGHYGERAMDAAKAAIVAKIAGLIAAELGLAPAECSTIEAATLLYCIGTLTFPDSILLKLRRLQSTKLPSIQMEPQEGAEFPHRHTSSSLRMAERMSLTRNERWDGEGWLGLSGETIPIESRIVAVAWAVDVLTMPRRRHSRKCLVQSVKQINSQSGALFDPDVVLAFNRVIRKDSIGSVS